MLLLVVFSFQFVYASSFSLTNIGALSTNGAKYSEWWYTGENPTLVGTAGSSADVNVDIDGSDSSAVAGGSGNWSLATSGLTAGDHNIVISSGSESYSFTLHIGQNVPESVGTAVEITESTSAVPNTGSDQFISLLLTTSLFITAVILFKADDVKKVFEKKVLEDLD